jgi:hypothetical protein
MQLIYADPYYLLLFYSLDLKKKSISLMFSEICWIAYLVSSPNNLSFWVELVSVYILTRLNICMQKEALLKHIFSGVSKLLQISIN